MLKFVGTITVLCIFLDLNRLVLVLSVRIPIPPELEARNREKLCREIEETEPKFPQDGDLVGRFTTVRTTLCNNTNFTSIDILKTLYKGLNNKQYLEIRVTWLGVQGYCDHVLSRSTLWRKPNYSRVNAADVKDQEYRDFQELCTSSLTTPQELVPAFQALQNKFAI